MEQRWRVSAENRLFAWSLTGLGLATPSTIRKNIAQVDCAILLRDWARAGGSALVETTRLAGRRIWAWLGIALLLARAASACGGSRPGAATAPNKAVSGADT